MEQDKSAGIKERAAGESDLWHKAFELCVRKTRTNIQRLADEPKSAGWALDGNYFAFEEGFFEIGNWTSSFFTGMALLAWQASEDEYFLRQTQRLASHYAGKVAAHHLDTHHDLGFLYSLYSVALFRLTGEREHRETGLRAASLLARRFNPTGRFIRAWGRMDTAEFADMAIIDCLMNLPLLYWAAHQAIDRAFYDIAVQHARTAAEHFIRADGSVYHAIRFDLKTGQVLRGDTYGGCAVESHWARGAAWALYGFALSYSYTRNPRFLEAALRVARKFIASLDEEVVPLWDFKLPADAPQLRDASAGAVAVCGLQELSRHCPGDEHLRATTRRLLTRLCSDEYLDFNDACPGIQRKGQVGDGMTGGARNAYTSWGDYFLMEAVARELHQFEPWW